MSLDDRLRAARDEDALLWDALLANGMTEGADVAVDSFFVADEERAARGLADRLTSDGATVSVEQVTARTRLLLRVTRWSVQSTATVPDATLAAVQAHTARMIGAAADAGAGYDGWGAQIPGA